MNTTALGRFGRRSAQLLRDMSIQAKLLVLTLGMLSLLLVITIMTTLNALGQLEERISAERLSQERSLLTERFSAEQNALKENALVLALHPSLMAAVTVGDRASLQRIAIPLRARYQLDRLEIVDVDNQSLLSDQPLASDLQATLKLALLTIEHITVVSTPQGMLLTAAVPLKDANGVQGGLLIGRLMDNPFLQQVNSNRTDPFLFLHAADGQVLAASTSENDVAVKDYSIDQATWQRALRGDSSESGETTVDGVPYRVSYVPLIIGERAQLVYSIALTTAEIQAFRTRTISQSIILLVIVGLVAFGMLFFIIRRTIIGPLTSLSVAADQLGAGDLNVPLVVAGRDEIGRLSSSFSAMTGQLRHSFATLEERNSLLQQEIDERKRVEEARTHLQAEVALAQATILEMSTPLIPIDAQTIVMPLIGAMDTQRSQQVLSTLLQGIETSRAQVAIVDITGVPVIDTQVAGVLLRLAQAVRLLGAQVVLTGIRPEVAQSLVGLGVDMRELGTYSTLEQAIASTRRLGHDRFQQQI
jgi:anti-anti-sigma regulatory factor/HAMP domain-containing protein